MRGRGRFDQPHSRGLLPYSGVFYEVHVTGITDPTMRTFDKRKAERHLDKEVAHGYEAKIVNCLTSANSCELENGANKRYVEVDKNNEPVAKDSMKVLVSFDDGAPHVLSNARGMCMTVAQYIAVTLFNGAGIEPDIVEVTYDGGGTRWEGRK
jgi:hypothetical protein